MEEPAWNGEELMQGLKYIRPGNGFVPNFPLSKKIDVNGAKEHGLYTYLKSICPAVYKAIVAPILYEPVYTEDVRWNYEKFLIGPNGRPIYRYSHEVEPANDRQLLADIQEEMNKLKLIRAQESIESTITG